MIGNELNIGFLSSSRKTDAKNLDFSAEGNRKSFTDIFESKVEYTKKENTSVERQEKFKSRDVAATMENSSRPSIKTYEEKQIVSGDSSSSEKPNETAIESEKDFKNVEAVESDLKEEKLESQDVKDVEEELVELIEAFLSGKIDDLEGAVFSSESFSDLSDENKNVLSEMLSKLTSLLVDSGQMEKLNSSDLKNFKDLIMALQNLSVGEVSNELKISLDEIKKTLEDININESKVDKVLADGFQIKETDSNIKAESGEIERFDVKNPTESDLKVEEIKLEKTENIQSSKVKEAEETDGKKGNNENESSEDEFLNSFKETNSQENSSIKGNEAGDSFKIESGKIINAEMKSEAALRNSKTPFEQKIMDQIVKGTKMSFNVEKDMSEIVIKLNPKELGNVAMKISLHNETLVAEFNVESKMVKETLESNLDDLRNALQEKGFSIEGMNVSVNQDSKNSFQEFEQMFKSKNGKRKYEEVVAGDFIDSADAGLSMRKSLENTSSVIDAFA